MPTYLDSLDLLDLFDAPSSFTKGHVRAQVLARCHDAGVDIGKGGDGVMFTLNTDVDALVSTIETAQYPPTPALPTIGNLGRPDDWSGWLVEAA